MREKTEARLHKLDPATRGGIAQPTPSLSSLSHVCIFNLLKTILGHLPLSQIEGAPVIDSMLPEDRKAWLNYSRVVTRAPAVAVTCGAAHTAAVLRNGTLVTFGKDWIISLFASE